VGGGIARHHIHQEMIDDRRGTDRLARSLSPWPKREREAKGAMPSGKWATDIGGERIRETEREIRDKEREREPRPREKAASGQMAAGNKRNKECQKDEKAAVGREVKDLLLSSSVSPSLFLGQSRYEAKRETEKLTLRLRTACRSLLMGVQRCGVAHEKINRLSASFGERWRRWGGSTE